MLVREQVRISNSLVNPTDAHILCPAHARMGGPFGARGSTESREQTIANGACDPYSGLEYYTDAS